MKKYIIKKADKIETIPDAYSLAQNGIASGSDSMTVSDGYHTMDELYDHRISLYIALCKAFVEKGNAADGAKVWKSKKHSDGSAYDGWFIMGIDTVPGEQITYHLPMDRWDKTSFAKERETAPAFDGHNSNDVLQRLGNI